MRNTEYRTLYTGSMSFWLLLFILWSPIAHGWTLQSGELRTLPKGQDVQIDVVIPKTDEYRLETKGQEDTKCTFFDQWRGQFAYNNDSGEGKNCRFTLRLAKGKYRLRIQKGNHTSKILLKPYKGSGVQMLKMGALSKEQLSAQEKKTFQVKLQKKRYVVFQAYGATLNHCRLLYGDNWISQGHPQTYKLRTLTKKGQLYHCQVAAQLEPGTYHFEVYGKTSRPTSWTKPHRTAPLWATFGTTRMKLYKRHYVSILPNSTRQLSLRAHLPKQQKGPFYLFIWADSKNKNPLKVSLYQHSRLNRYGSYRTYCYRYKRKSRHSRSSCMIVTRFQPGKRYSISLSGKWKQRVAVRYGIIYPTTPSLSANQSKLFFAFPNRHSYLKLNIKQKGYYWIDAGRKTRSCTLRKIQGHHSSVVHIKSMGLLRKPYRTNIKLSGNGIDEWIKVPTEGILQFETRGKKDTYCTLMNQNGGLIKNDDESGPGSNCRIKRRLLPGIYRIKVRPYNRSRSFYSSLIVSFQSRSQWPSSRQLGCNFKKFLEPGTYVLTSGQEGNLRVDTAKLFKLPLKKGYPVQINHLVRPFWLPVQLRGKYQRLTVKGASCALYRGLRLQQKGRVFGSTCTIRTSRTGKYRLQLKPFVRDNAGPGTVFYGSNRVHVKIGSASAFELDPFEGYQPLPSTTQVAAKVSNEPTTIALSRKTHFNIAQQQVKRFQFQLSRAGLYRFKTLGLLALRCTLQTPSIYSLSSNTRQVPDRNCLMQRYLQPGTYQLRLKALGQSAGRAGLVIQRISTRWAGFLKRGQRSYQRLTSSRARLHTVKIAKAGEYKLQVHSDKSIACRLNAKARWPIFLSNSCNWKGFLRKGNYFLWVHPEQTTHRYRAYLETTKQWSKFFPKVSGNWVSSHTNKPRKLPLHGSYKSILSNLGYDQYEFALTSATKMQFTLKKGMRGRLSLGNQFIANLPSQKPLMLASGKYKLIAQDKKEGSGTYYTIQAHILGIQPGSRIWRKVPSSLKIYLKEAQRITVETEGDRDVWCTLYNDKGTAIASNDNQSSKRWDCKLSRLLPKGTYTLRVDGIKSHSWISVSTHPLKDNAPISFTKAGQATVQGKQVQGFPFVLKQATPMVLKASGKRIRVSCTLEQQSDHASLGHSGGRRCRLFRLLAPGKYRWRVRSKRQDNKSLTVKTELKKLPFTSIKTAHIHTTELHPRKPKYVVFQIKNAGRYELDAKMPQVKHAKLRCALARQGHVLRWIRCGKSQFLKKGWYLWWMENRTRAKTQAQLTIKQSPIEAGKFLALRLGTSQKQQHPIQIKEAGFYTIQVYGNRAQEWGCRLGTQQTRWVTKASNIRCLIYAYLSQGTHTLHLWRSQDKNLQERASIFVKQLHKTPEKIKLSHWKGQPLQGQLDKNRLHQWSLPKLHTLGGSIALQGKGFAILTGKSGKVVEICMAHKANQVTQCQWPNQLGSSNGRLSIYSLDSTLQYTISLQEAKFSVQPQQLTVGTSYEWMFYGNNLRTFTIRGGKQAQDVFVEASEAGARCRLFHSALVWSKGCLQRVTLKANHTYTFTVHSKGSNRILVYSPGKRLAALWGIRGAQKTLPLPPRGQQQQLFNNEHYAFTVKKSGVYTFSARGSKMVCALTQSGNPLPIAVNSGGNGCSVEAPLAKGKYVFGVRGFAKLRLQGIFKYQRSSSFKIQEGRVSGHLLSSGSSLWFKFEVPKSNKIGIGAVASHEELRCKVLNAQRQQVKGTGKNCQIYTMLTKGTYWLQVALRGNAKATRLQLVLRGTKKPKAPSPKQLLKTRTSMGVTSTDENTQSVLLPAARTTR